MSMKIWSWTVDEWNAAFQILTILFVLGTVLTGAGKLWTDRIIKERHAQDLAKQQERAANAENELAKLKERTGPRGFTEAQLRSLRELLQAIPNKPPVEILTQEPIFPISETSDFVGEQLLTVFRESGFEVVLKHRPRMMPAGIHFEVLFREKLPPEYPPNLKPFVDFFGNSPILCSIKQVLDPAYDRVTLRIEVAVQPMARM